MKYLLIVILLISKIALIQSAGSCSGYSYATAPCTACQCQSEKKTSGSGWKTLYTGDWGGWKSAKYSPSDTLLACGAQMRGDGDDTGANGLKLIYCDVNNWSSQQTQTVWNGDWGTWKSVVMCPNGEFIDGGQIRYEDKQGTFGDDSALNGLRIRCSGSGNWRSVWNGNSGGWKGTHYVTGQYVCGAQVKYEGECGWACDDTAMNGMKFFFCQKSCSNSECTACANTYYLQSNDCKSCNYPCANCSSSSACTSCANGFYLGNSQCKTCSNWISYCDECHDFSNCKTCHDGYYLQGGICKPCVHPCVNCTSASNCLSCIGGAVGLNREDASKDCMCISTHTEIAATKKCEACLYPCQSCSGSTTSCTVCSTLSNRKPGPECDCSDGYFDDNSKCDICESPCKNCTSKSDCTSCATPFLLGGTDCLACNVWKPNCVACGDYQTCTTCEQNYYVDGSNSCVKCTINGCADCSQPSTCVKAIDGWVLVSGSDIPIPCLFPCTKCVNQPDYCTECVVSDPVRFSEKCSCPDGFYDDGYTDQCQKCMEGCKTCVRGDQCQYLEKCDSQCSSCLVFPDNCDTCAGKNREAYPSCKCKKGYFEAGGKDCQRCLSPCATCTSKDVCITCESSLFQMPPSCTGPSLGRVSVPFNALNQEESFIEVDCKPQCEYCENAVDNCLTCQGKNRAMEAPKCECLAGYHDENNSQADCMKCPHNCQECVSQTQCTVCDPESKRELNQFNGQCECQTGYAANVSNTKCEKCFQYQGECFIQCPKSTLANEDEFTCEDINYQSEDHFYSILYPALAFGFILVALGCVARRIGNNMVNKSAKQVQKPEEQGLKKQSFDMSASQSDYSSQKSEVEVVPSQPFAQEEEL